MSGAEEAEEMRARSGSIDSSDPVVALLYILMRDHLPIADVEEAAQQVYGGEAFQFSNGWLASYALDLRARLAGKIETAPLARMRKRNTL